MNTGAADHEVDAVVVGAGVVGLALARALARSGRQTLLLEAAACIGSGISARNSEVIHSGLYYAPGTLKAALCAPGRRALYAYCEARQVDTRRIGKVIVASDDAEALQLQAYRERALRNGVEALDWLDAAALHALEPALRGVAALYSPDTGIVDAHGLMQALLADVERAGGLCVVRSPVLHCRLGSARHRLAVGGAEPCTVAAPLLVNAAGLQAQALARRMDGFAAEAIPPLYYALGHYFALRGQAPMRHLVYPVAAAGGLGIHLTFDLAGQARFGPDVSWRDSEDYAFDAGRIDSFYRAIRRYWPGLPDGALAPGYTGIRPKLWGPARPEQDFMVLGPAEHGVDGLVQLFGIESPGLTCALALADYVLSQLPA